MSTLRNERLHTHLHFSSTVLALALLSTALASAQEHNSGQQSSSAIALLPTQSQPSISTLSPDQHDGGRRDGRREDNRVTITDRRIIENGSTDNSYNGFPGVVDARGGNYLLSYKKGTGHTNSPWVILRHSSDSGATWGPELFQWNTTSFDPTLARTPSQGALLIEFGKLDSSGTSGAAYARSSDEGFSWGAFTFFDSPPDNTSLTPTLYLIDGLTMYAAGYGLLADGSNDVSLWVSTDDGYTWVKMSTIRQAGDAGINETSIAKVGPTTLLAVSRDDANTNTWAHFSNDMGFTWGTQIDYTPQVGVLQDPQLLQTKPALLMFGRDPAANQLVVFASIDGGQTFTHRTILDTYTGRSIDGGYCWPILRGDGRVFVVYYADSEGLQLPDIKSLILGWSKTPSSDDEIVVPQNFLRLFTELP